MYLFLGSFLYIKESEYNMYIQTSVKCELESGMMTCNINFKHYANALIFIRAMNVIFSYRPIISIVTFENLKKFLMKKLTVQFLLLYGFPRDLKPFSGLQYLTISLSVRF